MEDKLIENGQNGTEKNNCKEDTCLTIVDLESSSASLKEANCDNAGSCFITPSSPVCDDTSNNKTQVPKQTAIVVCSDDDSCSWQYIDDDGSWIPFGKVGRTGNAKELLNITSHQIEQQYSTKKFTEMLIVIGDTRFVLDFECMTITNVLWGVSRPIRRHTESKNNYGLPSHWYFMQNSDQPTKVLLDPSDEEHVEEVKSIRWTLPGYTNQRVYRIQAPRLYRAYTERKRLLQRMNPTIHYYEEYLFHGTDYRNVDSICTYNFNCRLAGSIHGRAFGGGAYFTNMACIAARYSIPRGPPSLQDSKWFTVRTINGRTGEQLESRYCQLQRLNEQEGPLDSHPQAPIRQGVHQQPQVIFFPPSSVQSGPPQPVGNFDTQRCFGLFGPPQPVAPFGPPQSVVIANLQPPPNNPNPQQSINNNVPQKSSTISALQQPSNHPKQPNAIIVAKILIGRLCYGRPDMFRPDTEECGLPTDTAVNISTHPEVFVKFNNKEIYPEYYVEID